MDIQKNFTIEKTVRGQGKKEEKVVELHPGGKGAREVSCSTRVDQGLFFFAFFFFPSPSSPPGEQSKVFSVRFYSLRQGAPLVRHSHTPSLLLWARGRRSALQYRGEVRKDSYHTRYLWKIKHSRRASSLFSQPEDICILPFFVICDALQRHVTLQNHSKQDTSASSNSLNPNDTDSAEEILSFKPCCQSSI